LGHCSSSDLWAGDSSGLGLATAALREQKRQRRSFYTAALVINGAN
jgi:hypothetical protein